MGKLRSSLQAKWPKDVLTVDPGFGGTGWAYWLGNEFPMYGVITETKKVKAKTKEQRLGLLFTEFRCLLQRYKPSLCVIESMQIWSGSFVSHVAANRGDLFLLQTLVGGFCAIAQECNSDFKLINPMQWKGQLTKEAMENRILLINQTEYPEHTADAVGIGCHLAGIL